MEGPLRSFLLNGNLRNTGQLLLHIPHNDIKQGLWQISVKHIAFKANEIINTAVLINCNFVTDIRFAANNEIERYNATLMLYQLKAIKNEIKVNQYNDIWFTANSINDIIELSFYNLFSNTLLSDKDIDIYVMLLFKRIR